MLHVLFRVGEAEYLVPATDIVQMESFTGATRVPGTPPHVVGLVQVRGRVVPVLDLRARFGLPSSEPTLDSRIVVVRAAGREVALLVDRAREVLDLGEDQFRAPPDAIAHRASGFVRAVARAGERLLLLLDPEKIIRDGALAREETHGDQVE